MSSSGAFEAFREQQNEAWSAFKAKQEESVQSVVRALEVQQRNVDAQKRSLEAERAAFEEEKRALSKTMEKERQAKMEEVAQREAKLEKDIAAFAERLRDAESRFRDPSSIVELNVGGTHFETLKDTLTKVEGSMLEAMFCGRFPVTRDKQGRAFIDRDPSTFVLVLNYLRTDQLPAGLDKTRQQMFDAELVYFQLADEATQVPVAAPLTWKQIPSVTILADGKSVQKAAGGNCWNCNILASSGFSNGVHEWSIRRDKR